MDYPERVLDPSAPPVLHWGDSHRNVVAPLGTARAVAGRSTYRGELVTITVNQAGAGESWSALGARFRVLADGSAVDSRWGLIEGTLPPSYPGPPQHVHREHDESFFVLSGAVTFTSGREELVATPGTLVIAPIGDPHTFGNADADTSASFLCTVTPERYINYFRDLASLRPGPDGRLDPADLLELMSHYGTEPYRADSA